MIGNNIRISYKCNAILMPAKLLHLTSSLLHCAAVRRDVISCLTRSPPHLPLPVSAPSLFRLKQKLMWSLLFICYRGNFTPILCEPPETLSKPTSDQPSTLHPRLYIWSLHKMPGSWIIIFRWLIWGLGYYGDVSLL